MVSTLAAATAAGGTVNLVLTGIAWRHRDNPGGRWFLGMAGAMAASAFLYAVALTVTDPFVRHALEAAFWAGAVHIGLLWGAFALEYTGRGAVLRRVWPLGVLVGVGGGVMILLDPIHETLFPAFTVVGTTTATIDFQPGPGLFSTLAVIAVLIGAAWLLLADTLIETGPVFRRQTVALAITPTFPIVAAFLFVFDLGPVSGFNLVALSYAPHAALDLYALYSGELFEIDPATRRLGGQAAIESVGVPVVTVDTDGRVIAVNDPDDAVFDRPESNLVGESLNELLSTPIDPASDPGVVEQQTPAGSRQMRIRTTPFADAGRVLGYTVVFQDVTDVIARERRLSVLNRVLRHNLRNDLNVVVGHAELLADEAGENGDSADGSAGGTARSAEAIVDRGRRLLSISERARELDQAVQSADPTDTIELAAFCREVVTDTATDAVEQRVAVPDDVRLRTDRELLRIVLRNLVANAVEHGGREVTVRLAERDLSSVTVQVIDDGPGIPQTEIDVLDESAETALDHGSGLGLWVVQSATTALGGEVSFDASDDGTVVTLTIPGLVTDEQPATTESNVLAPSDE